MGRDSSYDHLEGIWWCSVCIFHIAMLVQTLQITLLRLHRWCRDLTCWSHWWCYSHWILSIMAHCETSLVRRHPFQEHRCLSFQSWEGTICLVWLVGIHHCVEGALIPAPVVIVADAKVDRESWRLSGVWLVFHNTDKEWTMMVRMVPLTVILVASWDNPACMCYSYIDCAEDKNIEHRHHEVVQAALTLRYPVHRTTLNAALSLQ